MAFIYYGQGMSSFYRNFVERLMSQLVLRGTEITHQDVGDRVLRMNVRYCGEEGQMEIAIDRDNVLVRYIVDLERKGVKIGFTGAIPGAGLGGIFPGERDAGDAIGGAVAGGAYEGYGSSHEEQTAFAGVLAEAVRNVEEELQVFLEGLESAPAAFRERGRQKRGVVEARTEELWELLEDLYGDLLALQEEVEVAAVAGQAVTKPRALMDRAETHYQEAETALEDDNHAVVKAKANAARAMVERARELLERAGVE